jgi:hypothetical protein
MLAVVRLRLKIQAAHSATATTTAGKITGEATAVGLVFALHAFFGLNHAQATGSTGETPSDLERL